MTSPEAATAAQKSAIASRRALLVGAVSGLGTVAVTALRPLARTAAANGDAVLIGGSYTATGTTYVDNSANTNTVLRVQSEAGGVGVWGSSDSAAGVFGTSALGSGIEGQSTSGVGVAGVSSGALPAASGWSRGKGTGVLGYSNGGAGSLPTAAAKTGVYGYSAQGTSSRGVWGRTTKGQGVRGQATIGDGLFGAATSGFALHTNGRLKADKVSGVATIPAGSSAITISPGVTVNSASFVLLTPRANIGSRSLWYTTNPASDTITLHLSASRSMGTKVAWLLVG